jgi:hypothetical protein
VVLAGHVHLPGDKVLYRLVAAPVAVFQLFRLPAPGQGKKLMPQADAEDGDACLAELLQFRYKSPIKP